jgi:hypothetical protein
MSSTNDLTTPEQKQRGTRFSSIFSKKKAGDTVSLRILSSRLVPMRAIRYPVLDMEKGETISRAIRFNPLDGKIKIDRDSQFITAPKDNPKFPKTLLNLIELQNVMLTAHRVHLRGAKVLSEDKISQVNYSGKTSKVQWKLDSQQYGALVLNGAEIQVIGLKNGSVNPKYAKAPNNPQDIDKGLTEYVDEFEDIAGQKYLKWPSLVTNWLLKAVDSKNKMFNESYLVWEPFPSVDAAYKQLVPASFIPQKGYAFLFPQPIFCRPSDLNKVQAWAQNYHKDPVLPPPFYNSTPDPTTGEILLVSRTNPKDFVKLNLYAGPMADVFTPEIVKKWADMPTVYSFDPHLEGGLSGGCYIELKGRPVKLEFSKLAEKLEVSYETEPERVYLSVDKNTFVFNQESKLCVYINPTPTGFVLAKGEQDKNPSGYAAELFYTEGMLWNSPLYLDTKDMNGNPFYGSPAVVMEVKKKAQELGVPVLGDVPPIAYNFLKDNQPLFSLASDNHAKRLKEFSKDSGDDMPDDEAPQTAPEVTAPAATVNL